MTTEYDLSRKLNRYDSLTSVSGTDKVAVYDVSAETMKQVTIDDLVDASGIEFKLGDNQRFYFGDAEDISLYESGGAFVINNESATGDLLFLLGDAAGATKYELRDTNGNFLYQVSSLGLNSFVNRRAERYAALDIKNYARQPGDVVSITRSGTTATVTTAVDHFLVTGEEIRMAGATQTEYNVTANVTVLTPTTFSYTVSGSPATPATTVANISYTDTTPLHFGQVIHDYTDASGSLHIDKVGSGTILNLYLANNDTLRPDKPAGYVGTADYLKLNDASSSWFILRNNKEWQQMSGTYTVAAVKADDAAAAFEFKIYAEHAIHTSFKGTMLDGDLLTIGMEDISIGTVSSITSSGTTCTVTTAANHELASGTFATIAGAVETDYNGLFAVTVTAPTTFTYTALTTPSASPATGSLTATARQTLLSNSIRYGEGMKIKSGVGDIKLDPYGTIDIDLTANAVAAETLSEYLNIKVGGVAKKLALIA